MKNPEQIVHKENILRRAEMMDASIIMDLLTKNLEKNLPEEEKAGGLFYEPTPEELEKIINDTGIYLCLSGTELKGYFVTMSKELAETIPFEAELVENADKIIYPPELLEGVPTNSSDRKPLSEYKYAILAQLLIAKEFRGGRIFVRLHDIAQSMLKEQGYELGIGEVRDENKASLSVHRFMTDIGTYDASSGIKWHVFVSDLRKY